MTAARLQSFGFFITTTLHLSLSKNPETIVVERKCLGLPKRIFLGGA